MAKRGDAGEFGPKVVLGQIIRLPDTPSGVSGRIKDEFGVLQFADNLAYTTVERLLDAGEVQPVGDDEGRRVTRLRATEKGQTSFAKWLHVPSSGVPPLRDLTRVRLQLCRDLDDLRRRCDKLSREIEACQAAQEDTRNRLIRTRRLIRQRPRDWRLRLDNALLVDEMRRWGNREDELSRLHRSVCVILREFDPAWKDE